MERKSQRMLAKVDRLARRSGLVREIDESLYRFADRVEAYANVNPTNNNDRLQRAAGWLRTFADARYQGKRPPQWQG